MPAVIRIVADTTGHGFIAARTVGILCAILHGGNIGEFPQIAIKFHPRSHAPEIH